MTWMSTGRMGPTLGKDRVKVDRDERTGWRDKNDKTTHKDRKGKAVTLDATSTTSVLSRSKPEVRTPRLSSCGHFNMCQVTVPMVTTAPLLFIPNMK